MENEVVIEEKEERQVLVFNVWKEELALDISCVREILIPPEIHPLPHAPPFIEGVINLRGHIIAVIDLRKRLDIKVTEDRPKMRIIICRIKKFIVGLIVDSVSDVVSLSGGDIDPTPEVVSTGIEDGYISGIARRGDQVIMLLDLEKILTEEETEKLSRIRQKKKDKEKESQT